MDNAQQNFFTQMDRLRAAHEAESTEPIMVRIRVMQQIGRALRAYLMVVGAATTVVIAGVGLFAWLADDSFGHEAPTGWTYPTMCCSLQDCRPTKKGEVTETRDGYTLTSTGEFVAHGDKRIKELSQDGEIHVCQQAGNFDTGCILCLLTPPKGV
jgi:hypothetical protein